MCSDAFYYVFHWIEAGGGSACGSWWCNRQTAIAACFANTVAPWRVQTVTQIHGYSVLDIRTKTTYSCTFPSGQEEAVLEHVAQIELIGAHLAMIYVCVHGSIAPGTAVNVGHRERVRGHWGHREEGPGRPEIWDFRSTSRLDQQIQTQVQPTCSTTLPISQNRQMWCGVVCVCVMLYIKTYNSEHHACIIFVI